MAVDDLFEIAREVSVKSDCGAMSLRQRDGLGQKAATRWLRGTNEGYRPRIMLNDDFVASSHALQYERKIARPTCG